VNRTDSPSTRTTTPFANPARCAVPTQAIPRSSAAVSAAAAQKRPRPLRTRP